MKTGFWTYSLILACICTLGCTESDVSASEEGKQEEPVPQVENDCEVDEVACFDKAVHYCENGKWVRQEKCQYGCHYNAMECAAKPDEKDPDPKPVDKVCTDGDVQCADGVLKKCEDNAWSESDCPHGCNEEGTACKDEQPEPPGPIDQKECEGDAVVCEDGIKKTCSDGTWKTENCEYGCHENGVDCAEPACEVGQLLCADDQLKKCNGTEWVLEMPCDKGCKSNEACAAVCREGEIVCDGDMLKTCQNDAWSEKKCDSGCDESTKKCIEVNNNVPTRYITGSGKYDTPITPYVVQQMKNIMAKNGSRNNDVIIKVGDSHYDAAINGGTLTYGFMRCFSNNVNYKVTLDGRDYLQAAIDEFQKTKDSFIRDSEAAVGGQSTRYSFLGTPTHLTAEINAMNPRFAVFGHGSNDIGNGSFTYTKSGNVMGYAWALEDYYRQVNKALDQMIEGGIIPIIQGIAPNLSEPANINYIGGGPIDKRDYPRYIVPAFDAVSRGIAEARQLPWFDTYNAFWGLPGHGVRSDHVHETQADSPCDFTAAGLQFGANVRNLSLIETLSASWKTVVKGEAAPGAVIEPFKGNGSKDDPFVVTSLPFTHSADMSKSTNKAFDKYSCSSTAEPGAENYYKLVLTEKKRLKMFVVSGRNANGEVDQDIHVLKGSIDANQCVTRANILLMGTLDAGTYYISIDTCDNPGQYLMGVVECLSDDKRCDDPLQSFG